MFVMFGPAKLSPASRRSRATVLDPRLSTKTPLLLDADIISLLASVLAGEVVSPEEAVTEVSGFFSEAEPDCADPP